MLTNPQPSISKVVDVDDSKGKQRQPTEVAVARRRRDAQNENHRLVVVA